MNNLFRIRRRDPLAQDATIHELQQRVYGQYLADGMIELACGVIAVLITLSLAMQPGDISYLLFLLLLLPVVILLRRHWRNRFTYPRLGYSDTATRPAFHFVPHVLFGIAVLFALRPLARLLVYGLEHLGADGVLLRETLRGQPFEILWLALGTGFVMNYGLRRLYAYVITLPLLMLFLVAVALQVDARAALAGIGILMIFIGILRLRRLLRNNPLSVGDEVLHHGG